MKELKKTTFSALDYTNFRYKHRPDYLKLKDEPQCGTWDAPMLAYFNKDSVKKSLKIDASVTNFELCKDKFDYTKSKDATFSIY